MKSNYFAAIINGFHSGFSKYFLSILLIDQSVATRQLFLWFLFPYAMRIFFSFLLKNINLKSFGNSKTIIVFCSFFYWLLTFCFFFFPLEFNLWFFALFFLFSTVCAINEVFMPSYQLETLTSEEFKQHEKEFSLLYYLAFFISGTIYSHFWATNAESIKLFHTFAAFFLFILTNFFKNVKKEYIPFDATNMMLTPIKNLFNNFSASYFLFLLFYKSQDFFFRSQLWSYLKLIGYRTEDIVLMNFVLLIPQLISGYLALYLINKLKTIKNIFKILIFARLILTGVIISLSFSPVSFGLFTFSFVLEKIIKTIDINCLTIYQAKYYSKTHRAYEIAYISSLEQLLMNLIVFLAPFLLKICSLEVYFACSFLFNFFSIFFLRKLKS